MAKCPTCGGELERDARFCGICGRRQTGAPRRITSIPPMAPPDRGLLRDLFQADTLFDWRRALEIVAAIASGVAEARARGAELSLAPESLFLERENGAWTVMILDDEVRDFGRDVQRDTDVMRAPPGVVLPTAFEYHSPERVMDKPLDGASDVYTFGVFAYELVTGRLPFPEARNPAMHLTAQLKHKVTPPSQAIPQAKIPVAVDALVLRCLERDPRARLPDAGSMAHAIGRLLAAEPVQPARPMKRARANTSRK